MVIMTDIIGGAKSTTHLLFANDLLCFSKDNVKSLKAIKHVLTKFSIFYGLQISPSKSKIILSKSCQYKKQLLQILGFEEGCLPFKYLGFPIVGRD